MKKELENLKIDHDTLVQQKVSHNSRIQNLQREIEDEKDRGLKNNHIIEVRSWYWYSDKSEFRLHLSDLVHYDVAT